MKIEISEGVEGCVALFRAMRARTFHAMPTFGFKGNQGKSREFKGIQTKIKKVRASVFHCCEADRGQNNKTEPH